MPGWATELANRIPCSLESISAQQAALKGLQGCVESGLTSTSWNAHALYSLMKAHEYGFKEFKAEMSSSKLQRPCILVPEFLCFWKTFENDNES